MYAFHEGKYSFNHTKFSPSLVVLKSFWLRIVSFSQTSPVPKHGRDKILAEARRLLIPGGTLAVVDIYTDFTPPLSILLGEPYEMKYQQNIQKHLRTIEGFRCLNVSYPVTLVCGH